MVTVSEQYKLEQEVKRYKEKAENLDLAMSQTESKDFTDFTNKWLVNLIKAKEWDNFKQKLEKYVEKYGTLN